MLVKQRICSKGLPQDRETFQEKIPEPIHELNEPNIMSKLYDEFIIGAGKCFVLDSSLEIFGVFLIN